MLWLGKETPKPAFTGGKLPNRRLLRLRLSVLIAERSKSFPAFKTKSRNGKCTVKKLWPSATGGGASVVVHSENLHPYLSLCSGAGGLDIGIERGSGGTAFPVCYVEREITAAATLASNITQGTLADAPIWSDLKTFDFTAWRGHVEGIVGGYPCQPFSQVGPKLGEADPRNLWNWIEAGIKAVRPIWCFFENVSGHLSLGFTTVAESLRGMGYEVAATLVTAEETGAPHRRERLFILAYTESERHERSAFKRKADIAIGAEPNGRFTESGGSMANTSGNGRKKEGVRRSSASGRPTGEMELPSRFPYGPTDPGWMDVPGGLQPSLLKSEFHRLDDGMGAWVDLSRQDRLRIAGNGVVPDAAAVAWCEIWEAIG